MSKYICPKCKKKEAVGILYGYPGDGMLESAKRKEIVLGGCIIYPKNPDRQCLKCGHQWKSKKDKHEKI
jgi:hypothetical protein